MRSNKELRKLLDAAEKKELRRHGAMLAAERRQEMEIEAEVKRPRRLARRRERAA